MRAFFVLFAFLALAACQGNASFNGDGDPRSQDDAENGDTTDSVDMSDNSDSGTNEDAAPDLPEPLCDDTYVGPSIHQSAQKVKTLLAGTGLTSDEYLALENDPSQLKSMVLVWLETPQGQNKLRMFFQSAFQQEGFEDLALAEMYQENQLTFRFGRVATNPDLRVGQLWKRNVEESFVRTVFQMIEDGRPFNEVLTTREFMMTPAMMVFMAQHDERILLDEVDGRTPVQYRNGTITQLAYQNQDAAVYDHTDMASVDAYGLTDPNSPNFMRFYIAPSQDLMPQIPECQEFTRTAANYDVGRYAFRAFVGSFFKTVVPGECRNNSGGAEELEGFLRPEDFNTWKMVTIRQPAADETPDQFYELTKFRDPATTELVLHTKRVGFMTTQAFFAQWVTNADNQARVTANQMLIVGLSDSMEDVESNVPLLQDALDDSHADPGTACYGCHKALDPFRQYFRGEYTYGYAPQTDPVELAKNKSFLWRGTSLEGGDIVDLAQTFSSHPNFEKAWLQKMCFFATSKACPDDDATLESIAANFRTSGNVKDAMADLYSSSLVTGVECVPNGWGDDATISRARHFCNTIQTRLTAEGEFAGVQFCNLGTIRALTPILPDDAFSRGDHNPITISSPSLVVRAAYEKICDGVATRVVRGDSSYNPNTRDETIQHIVEDFMGLPPEDPKYQQIIDVLTTHYDNELGQTDAPTAMRSVFSAACMTPSVMALGL